MVYILLAVHIYFCFKTKFIQRYTLKGIRHSLAGDGHGSYTAFAQALGTTVGPGNIVGVALAISTGGAGAVFWMWLCGILAMPTKFAESYLSLKYKIGSVGGSSVLLKRFGYKKTALLWVALCMAAGIFMGAAVPSNALCAFLPFDGWVTGLFLALAVAFAISVGTDGIGKICCFVVPFMSLGFIALCIYVLLCDPKATYDALLKIIFDALSPTAFASGTVAAAVKSGMTRGLYSNEAGLGSGGVLAAMSDDGDIGLGSLGAMTTCFWDTVVMCALTGVVFVAGGTSYGSDPEAAVLCSFAKIPFSEQFLALAMTLFVYATVIGWYCVACQSAKSFNIPQKAYSTIFSLAVFFGALLPQNMLWGLSDTVNFLMLVPSLFIFVKLSDKISLHIK